MAVFTNGRYAGTPAGDYLTAPDGRLLLLPGLGDQPTPAAPVQPDPWLPADREVAYGAGLAQMTPVGAAWCRAPGSVLRGVIDAIGAVLARLHTSAEQTLGQAIPERARSMLPELEASVGLPTACLPELAPTLPLRAAEAALRWRAIGGASPAYFVALARSAGFVTRITEYRPSRFGQPLFGAALVDAAASHWWKLSVESDGGGGAFQFADNRFGDPFAWPGRIDALKCLIAAAMPAHTRVAYEEVAPGSIVPLRPGEASALPDGSYLTDASGGYLVAGGNNFLVIG